MKHSYSIVLNSDFEQAMKSVIYCLTNEGFDIVESGNIDEIAMGSKKSRVKHQRILCKYNPVFQNQSPEIERSYQNDIPHYSNVIVGELGPGEIEISFINPETSFNPYYFKLHKNIILRIEESLQKVMEDVLKY
jgi:uncharacterized protein (DUF302 family)